MGCSGGGSVEEAEVRYERLLVEKIKQNNVGNVSLCDVTVYCFCCFCCAFCCCGGGGGGAVITATGCCWFTECVKP